MSLEQHGWDIHAVCSGTGGAGVTAVRSRARTVAPGQQAKRHAAVLASGCGTITIHHGEA